MKKIVEKQYTYFSFMGFHKRTLNKKIEKKSEGSKKHEYREKNCFISKRNPTPMSIISVL